MSEHQKPKDRPGHTITAVWWNRDGSLRWVKYEAKAALARAAAADAPDPAPERPRRGLLAAERATRAATAPDLFG